MGFHKILSPFGYGIMKSKTKQIDNINIILLHWFEWPYEKLVHKHRDLFPQCKWVSVNFLLNVGFGGTAGWIGYHEG
jgi:hypothetical protein